MKKSKITAILCMYKKNTIVFGMLKIEWLQIGYNLRKSYVQILRKIKKEPTQNHRFMRVFGGEQGIRTLEPLVTVTRFP
ncbi:MAG: hypothetical protein KH231_07755, partial [Dialister sp.]|uniref:hypothetical protein n=1 Tax=Dialister sp. TaxID=1955814 RepID=UPI001DD38A43